MSKKISELTAAGALTGTEKVPMVQDGETVAATVDDLLDLRPTPIRWFASVSQVGTDAPIKNFVFAEYGEDDFVLSREGVGEYTISGSNIGANTTFLSPATFSIVTITDSDDVTVPTGFVRLFKNGNNAISIRTFDGAGVAADDILQNFPIQIIK